jgi:mRNA interferase MazF
MPAGYVPARGDFVWLEFNPQAGHEQAGHRPAFVISPEQYNRKTGLALVCPIATQVKGYPFEVVVPQGLKVKGAILSDHIKSLDWRARRAAFIGRAPATFTAEVLAKAATLIS